VIHWRALLWFFEQFHLGCERRLGWPIPEFWTQGFASCGGETLPEWRPCSHCSQWSVEQQLLPIGVHLHHVFLRIDKMCTTATALSQLLRHIGSMSVHQLCTESTQWTSLMPHSPFHLGTSGLPGGLQSQVASLPEHGQIQAVDVEHFQKVLDILGRAIQENDSKTALCMLLVLQVASLIVLLLLTAYWVIFFSSPSKLTSSRVNPRLRKLSLKIPS
jgi:hypothetical protein